MNTKTTISDVLTDICTTSLVGNIRECGSDQCWDLCWDTSARTGSLTDSSLLMHTLSRSFILTFRLFIKTGFILDTSKVRMVAYTNIRTHSYIHIYDFIRISNKYSCNRTQWIKIAISKTESTIVHCCIGKYLKNVLL